MLDWGLIACAFGLHDWQPYDQIREGVLFCGRCAKLRFRYPHIEKALREAEREERRAAARFARKEESP